MSSIFQEPSDEQLREYEKRLPKLYREIIRVFRDASPTRKYGEGLLDTTIYNHLKMKLGNQSIFEIPPPIQSLPATAQLVGLSDMQISEALTQLVVANFLERRAIGPFGIEKDKFEFNFLNFPLGTIAYCPTALGERLLQIITGTFTESAPVPQLPRPNWR